MVPATTSASFGQVSLSDGIVGREIAALTSPGGAPSMKDETISSSEDMLFR